MGGREEGGAPSGLWQQTSTLAGQPAPPILLFLPMRSPGLRPRPGRDLKQAVDGVGG
jgi:hypothetical protein